MRRLGTLSVWLGTASAIGALFAAPAIADAASPEIQAYQHSWVHRALGLQYKLGGSLPLRNAPWVGTHNSFNSVAEMGPTLSDQDSNQKLALVDQLRIDIRSLELDLHWFPSVSGGGFAPVVCHATEQHGGCTIEKTLGPVLDEISGWLRKPAHRRQVILLYLEDHLDNQQGYDTAAGILRDKLGDLLYRPPAGGCAALPMGLTRDRIRAAGAQVIMVGNSDCGIGSEWPSVVFDWSAHGETRPVDYTDFPSCGPDFTRAEYNTKLIRYFEDSTQLTAGTGVPDDGITPRTASAMSRCGVDLFGLDQLLPGDGRLKHLVWSWAKGQPKRGTGRCAIQRVDAKRPFGRWFARRCGVARRPACRRGARWLVLLPHVPEQEARRRCQASNARQAVPRTGFQAQRLRLAMERAGARAVWLGYHRAKGGRWVAGG